MLVLKDLAEQFVNWTKSKIRYHCKDPKVLYLREKEVWWAALGKNVGYEVNGKHELFERPVLIIKKYSEDMCFVLPLTTQIKDPLPWYQSVIIIDGEASAVNISQGKTISTKRLLRKITTIDSASYNKIISLFTDSFKTKATS